MQLGLMVTHMDSGQHLCSSYMYTVIWLVNNDLSEVSVKIHSVTGIIESEPNEPTPYGTLISPNLNCDLVTSLSSSNLNLNSAVCIYDAL